MTDDNKDALLCAKTLERSWAQVHCHFPDLKEAAQRLRRLVAENERLSAVNAELLEALKAAKGPLELYNAYGWADRKGVRAQVDAAIQKAEEA